MRPCCLTVMAMSLAVVMSVAPAVFAETADAETGQDVLVEQYVQPPAPHWHHYDPEWLQKFHKPADWISLGYDLRLRTVYAENMFTLDDQGFFPPGSGVPDSPMKYQRYRSRLSGQFNLTEDIDFNARLVWEFWTRCRPEETNRSTDFDEAIFDHFNVQFRNVADLPLTLTVGRQDIILGTGWLVLEGTPADGSRTIFFDAIRGTYEISDTTKLDLIYIKQYDNEAKWLKPFNHTANRDRRHNTQLTDEEGVIVYLTDRSFDDTTLEGYYIYKNDDDSTWSQSWSGNTGQDAEIHTIGGRIAQQLDENWSYSAELAGQWGNRDGSSQRGLGANTSLSYSFNDEWSNRLKIAYEYLSGDDPDSTRDERFDTLWGQWVQPQRCQDLQAYIWAMESGHVGQVNNLHLLGLGHSFKPHESWTIVGNYSLMWADEHTAISSGTSKFRGQALTGVATYSCCPKFSTHFLVDYFIPGNYYAPGSRDDAVFARINTEWTF